MKNDYFWMKKRPIIANDEFYNEFEHDHFRTKANSELEEEDQEDTLSKIIESIPIEAEYDHINEEFIGHDEL